VQRIFVVVLLALAIGANTAVFTLVDRVLLRPLPYGDAGRLMEISGQDAKGEPRGMWLPAFEFLRTRVTAFDGAAAWRWQNFLLTGSAYPENMFVLESTPPMFDLLAAPAQMGRTLRSQDRESGAPPVVVLAHRLWRRQFEADPNIVGRQILLDGRGYTVVGVMPPDFYFPRPDFEMWIPLRTDTPEEGLRHGITAMGRLRPGATLEQAQKETLAVSALMPKNPKMPEAWHATVRPLTQQFAGPARESLLVLWGAVGLVLLIACANAANLLLTRAAARRREFAIRAAMGASAASLTVRLFRESLALGAAAGVAGVALAYGALRIVLAAFPRLVPQIDRVTVSGPALAVTAGLVLLTTFLCALPPAIDLWRADLAQSLGAGGRGSSASRAANRTRSVLIAVEVALSLVLLMSAGLMMRSLHQLLAVRLGFQPQQVLTARISVPPQMRKTADQSVYYTRILDDLRSMPGVRAAAITTVLPLGSLVATTSFFAEGSPVAVERSFPTFFRSISPDYFAVLGTKVLRGRPFAEVETGPVAIVNESLARHYWPGEDPVGKRVSREDRPKPEDWLTVVGLVEDTRHRGLSEEAGAELYLPSAQDMTAARFTSVVLRTAGQPEPLVLALQKQIHKINPDQPVADVRTMEELIRSSTAESRFAAALLETFASLALVLAVSGIFAVVSYSVTQRTREIGVRAALGADPGAIVRYVLGLVLRPALAGTVVGIAGVLAVMRFLESQLYGVKPSDPLVFASVLMLLLATALAATAFPARRAARIDPATTLRAE
jgi:predicted permease